MVPPPTITCESSVNASPLPKKMHKNKKLPRWSHAISHQLEWLKDELANSTALWKILVTSVTLSVPTGPDDARDGWANMNSSTGYEIEVLRLRDRYTGVPFFGIGAMPLPGKGWVLIDNAEIAFYEFSTLDPQRLETVSAYSCTPVSKTA